MKDLEKELEIKQVFLVAAIENVSADIQLSDTKVSIIMAALTTLIAGAMACFEPIAQAFSKITPCSWRGIILTSLVFLQIISFTLTFVCGILTIRGHASSLGFDSKWYLTRHTKDYSFEAYKADVCSMTGSDVVENMAAELYKLNDINRQKLLTVKWALRSFATALGTTTFIGLLLLTARL